MKRFRIYLCYGCLLMCILSCNKYENFNDDLNPLSNVPPQRTCVSDDVLQARLSTDPAFKARRDQIERQTRDFIAKNQKGNSISSVGPDGTIYIPVAIHVIYSTSLENISEQQIRSQIDVLNRDFNLANSDASLIPGIFQSVAGNLQFQFRLKSIDRRSTTVSYWDPDQELYKSSSTGGINTDSPGNTLNIWICNLREGSNIILGYGTPPGTSSSIDGVAVGPNYFGTTGYVSSPYNLGRTATHEVGHWMNLVHIWGTSLCGNDLVSDTPVHQDPNYNCPSFPITNLCTGSSVTEMTMNYMDYTDDACMYMFTAGQKLRARAVFAPLAARSGFMTVEPDDEYLVGDWDGNGTDNIAVRRHNTIYMDIDFDNIYDLTMSFGDGNAEDQYLVGDWNGDGIDDIAVRRDNTILMDWDRDGLTVEAMFDFGDGNAEDQYFAGDWNGDGSDDIGIRRDSTMLLDWDRDGLTVEATFTFGNGNSEDQYLVADWNADGVDDIGIRRGALLLRDWDRDGTTVEASSSFGLGNTEDQYLTGDWDGNGEGNVGVRRDYQLYLDWDWDGGHNLIQDFGSGT